MREYRDILKRLHLYVHDTGRDYAYPDKHVKILRIIRPRNASMMFHVGFEDLEDLSKAQWNDCYLNFEFANDGKWWIEGRFTGAYRKTLWFDRPKKGRIDIATYFQRVWFTVKYDPDTEDIWWGEYW